MLDDNVKKCRRKIQRLALFKWNYRDMRTKEEEEGALSLFLSLSLVLLQTYLWYQSQAGSAPSRTSSLTPPAWQTAALPAGGLAAVGVDTVAPLQAARPKRAHLQRGSGANGGRKNRQGESLERSASSARVRQNTTLAGSPLRTDTSSVITTYYDSALSHTSHHLSPRAEAE